MISKTWNGYAKHKLFKTKLHLPKVCKNYKKINELPKHSVIKD